MSTDEDLFRLVPIGEENAVSGRLIWRQYGMWSSASIKHRLNEMAAKGLIRRKKIEQPAATFFVYYRLS